MNEEQLISLAQTGDLFAFNELVGIYQSMVYNLCLRVLSDPSEADDAAQETFITAFRNLHQFKGGTFKGWILRCATNQCIDLLRKQKRRSETILEPLDSDGDEKEDPSWLRDTSADPSEAVEQAELSDLIQKCINELGLDQRLVMVLIDVFEMDYKEVQQIIQKPLGTVKSRLVRARESVKQCLLSIVELYPAYERYGKEKI